MIVPLYPELPISNQFSRIGNQCWAVARLIELTKEFKVFDAPLCVLQLETNANIVSLREFAARVNRVNEADLSYPIILDEDGVIMDGRHRVIKALLVGRETIKAVRFEENPPPCRVEE